MNLQEKYPHLRFETHWHLTSKIMFLLGQCQALVHSICNTPILPENHSNLLRVSLIKGAQSTTAIEGNTLTEDEINKIQQGEKLPLSKAYQEIEVKNILNAYNELLKEVVYENKVDVISVELLKRFHIMVGKDLGEHFDANPGKLREDNRIVGKYRCPDYNDVPDLLNNFCEWLLKEFHFKSNNQQFFDIVIEAIVAHVYLEWIHPFGDGNGRTGRLLEFYILLRGKNPDISSHIMANHYNNTRTEYYRQLENARLQNTLTHFIEYALQGLFDGLTDTIKTVQESQYIITWQKYIYDKFVDVKLSHKEVFKRRRDLILAMPINKGLTLDDIVEVTPKIARAFGGLSLKTISRDVQELINLDLVYKEGGKYFANSRVVKGYLAQKRK